MNDFTVALFNCTNLLQKGCLLSSWKNYKLWFFRIAINKGKNCYSLSVLCRLPWRITRGWCTKRGRKTDKIFDEGFRPFLEASWRTIFQKINLDMGRNECCNVLAFSTRIRRVKFLVSSKNDCQVITFRTGTVFRSTRNDSFEAQETIFSWSSW